MSKKANQQREGFYVHELGGKFYAFLDGRNCRGPYETTAQAEAALERAEAARAKLRAEAQADRPTPSPRPAAEPAPPPPLPADRDFPDGTVLRAVHKGEPHTLTVLRGGGRPCYEHDGTTYRSPSAAAKAITGTSVNGWKFWRAS